MKNLFLILLSIIFTACASSTQLMMDKKYDEAIDLSIKKLLKSPNDTEEVSNLKRAYEVANQEDIAFMNHLKRSASSYAYEQIHSTNIKLMNRQEKLKNLSVSTLNAIGFQPVDYIAEIANAKTDMINNYYTKATNLLKKGDKPSAREAYTILLKLRKYDPAYKDVNKKIEEALNRGSSTFYAKLENNTKVALPDNYEQELMKSIVSEIKSEWIKFTEVYDSGLTYDYVVNIALNEMEISPGKTSSRTYTEVAEVEDGYEYALDKNGNVMKDKNGNDVKRVKYKKVGAEITEITQQKAIQVKGMMNISKYRYRNAMESEPFEAQSVFQNIYATGRGDGRAVTQKTNELLKKKEVKYPADEVFVQSTTQKVKDALKEFIGKHQSKL